MAAAALTLAINVATSPVSKSLGLPTIADLHLDSLLFENVIRIEMDGVRQGATTDRTSPLKIWSEDVLKVTNLDLERDLKPAYRKMVAVANSEHEFNGKLSIDPCLFLKESRVHKHERRLFSMQAY